jgi:beta-ureidopropionase / N-carbamoyl-L-amino-acid hydrolase
VAAPRAGAPRVDGPRLRRDLTDLARFGATASGGVSRASYSAADSAARQWYAGRCAEAGLTLWQDGLGNMFAQWGTPRSGAAARPAAGPAAVWSGSHLDSVPDGGRLDGALGALAALECVRRLAELGVDLARPVRAVVFADEEGSYGHLLGSRGVVDGYTDGQLSEMTGRDGDRLLDALASCSWTNGPATQTKVSPEEIQSFVELHIEQGPELERAGTDIGIVTSIVGLGGGTAEFLGQADHAGTTPMNQRRDALRAAGTFVADLPRVAASVSPAAVITCGLITVEPGAANVVPRLARLIIDFRDPDPGRLRELSGAIGTAAERAAARCGAEAAWHPTPLVEPVPLDPGVRSAISRAASGIGLGTLAMPSGAGHDAQNLARITPTGMIFVPSVAGRSHSPAEHTSWRDVENGANVLLATLIDLASR